MVEIQWKIDSSWVAGDNERLDMTEWAVSVKRTKEGKLSIFRRTNKKPLNYIYNEDNYTEDAQRMFINEVEYFFANTTNKDILQYFDDENIKITIAGYEYHSNGNPNIITIIGSDNKQPFTLGIALHYEGEEYYNRTYYQLNEKTDKFIKIQ